MLEEGRGERARGRATTSRRASGRRASTTTGRTTSGRSSWRDAHGWARSGRSRSRRSSPWTSSTGTFVEVACSMCSEVASVTGVGVLAGVQRAGLCGQQRRVRVHVLLLRWASLAAATTATLSWQRRARRWQGWQTYRAGPCHSRRAREMDDSRGPMAIDVWSELRRGDFGTDASATAGR